MTAREDHLAAREQEKEVAVAAILEAFSDIARRGPEPDAWERTFLVQAINWLFRGGYALAVIDARVALMPLGSRAADVEHDPSFDRFDTSILRKALVEAVSRPVEPFPIFGPVVLTTAHQK